MCGAARGAAPGAHHSPPSTSARRLSCSAPAKISLALALFLLTRTTRGRSVSAEVASARPTLSRASPPSRSCRQEAGGWGTRVFRRRGGGAAARTSVQPPSSTPANPTTNAPPPFPRPAQPWSPLTHLDIEDGHGAIHPEARNVHGRVDQAPGVVAQVQNEALHTITLQAGRQAGRSGRQEGWKAEAAGNQFSSAMEMWVQRQTAGQPLCLEATPSPRAPVPAGRAAP